MHIVDAVPKPNNSLDLMHLNFTTWKKQANTHALHKSGVASKNFALKTAII